MEAGVAVDAVAVSIHAPVKGATDAAKRWAKKHAVSIHAPVKGATSALRSRPGGHNSFNPRPREGGDPEQ